MQFDIESPYSLAKAVVWHWHGVGLWDDQLIPNTPAEARRVDAARAFNSRIEGYLTDAMG